MRVMSNRHQRRADKKLGSKEYWEAPDTKAWVRFQDIARSFGVEITEPLLHAFYDGYQRSTIEAAIGTEAEKEE